MEKTRLKEKDTGDLKSVHVHIYYRYTHVSIHTAVKRRKVKLVNNFLGFLLYSVQWKYDATRNSLSVAHMYI